MGGHELSKPKVIVRSWSAERIGPRIIAAPQRGHAQVAADGVSVAVDDGATAVGAEFRSVRARAMRVVRQVLARKADCRRRVPDYPHGRRVDEAVDRPGTPSIGRPSCRPWAFFSALDHNRPSEHFDLRRARSSAKCRSGDPSLTVAAAWDH